MIEKITLYSILFFFLIMLKIDLVNCHGRYCGSNEFQCGCRHQSYHLHSIKNCIKRPWICDGVPDCDDGSDEIDCVCSENEFQCSECARGLKCQDEQIFYCISQAKGFDDQADCWNKKDIW